jgi:hypothetical protein
MEDFTPRVRKIDHLLQSGESRQAQRLLPTERRYPVSPEIGRRLLIEPAGMRRHGAWQFLSALGQPFCESEDLRREYEQNVREQVLPAATATFPEAE